MQRGESPLQDRNTYGWVLRVGTRGKTKWLEVCVFRLVGKALAANMKEKDEMEGFISHA